MTAEANPKRAERASTRQRMERAHALESEAGGGIALALACGRGLSRARLTRWRDCLAEAAALLDSIVEGSGE